MIRVCFREDNENEARAKNAEYRSAKISNDTFEFLMDYLAKYRKILQHQDYRKMSNQRMADETREVRQRMSDIIYMSLARMG